MNLSIITVGIKTPGNLGAIARLCDNYSCDYLIAVAPECNVADNIAFQRASRGKQYLENIIVVEKLEDAMEYIDLTIGLSSRIGTIGNFSRPAIAIQEVSEEICQLEGKVAIVLGREDFGLTNDEVAQCDMLVHIPTHSNNPVLNISHAAATALYELVRHKQFSSIKQDTHRLMKRSEKEYFLNYLQEILMHSWLVPEKVESTIRVFRTILSRSLVTNRESPALVGTMRTIRRAIVDRHGPNCDCEKEVNI